jgi:hypothetical protein
MLVTETGEMFYMGEDLNNNAGYLEAIGNLSVAGNVVTGPTPSSVVLFSSDECPWDVCPVNTQSNPTTTFGPLSGTVVGRTSMTLNGISWIYNGGIYGQPSSFATIAGSWSGSYVFGANGGATLSIDTNGVMYAADTVDSGSTCVINGQVSLIDTAYNAYDIAMTYSNCTDIFDQEVNGLTGVGTGYIDYGVSPSVLRIIVLFPNAPTSASSSGLLLGDYQFAQQ